MIAYFSCAYGGATDNSLFAWYGICGWSLGLESEFTALICRAVNFKELLGLRNQTNEKQLYFALFFFASACHIVYHSD